jgi:hypothetical protein
MHCEAAIKDLEECQRENSEETQRPTRKTKTEHRGVNLILSLLSIPNVLPCIKAERVKGATC